MQIDSLFDCLVNRSRYLIKALIPRSQLQPLVKSLNLDESRSRSRDFGEGQIHVQLQFVILTSLC